MRRCSFSSSSLCSFSRFFRSVLSWTFPPEPELSRGAPRIHRIERHLEGRRNPFQVVRVHELHDLFLGRLIVGKIENLLSACIAGEHAMTQIVLVRPELGCVEGKLETVFARFQVCLRSL